MLKKSSSNFVGVRKKSHILVIFPFLAPGVFDPYNIWLLLSILVQPFFAPTIQIERRGFRERIQAVCGLLKG